MNLMTSMRKIKINNSRFKFPPVRPPKGGCRGIVHLPLLPPTNGYHSFSIRVGVPEQGSVLSAMVCVSMDEEQARNEIKVIQGEWSPPQSPRWGDIRGGK